MLFNSLQFVQFFVIFYVLYLFLQKNLRLRNWLLLIASYIFYGTWSWRFLGLIFLSTVVDYNVGLALGRMPDDTDENKRKRKLLLAGSVIVNLGVLGVFKYFNFFAESFTGLLNLVGLHVDAITLAVILPVGISFYTFQTLSYTFDVYRKDIEPAKNFIDFATFVAFFPQLVAGPIERSSRLLPQVQSILPIRAQQIHSGLFLIVWGLFQKVVIADNAAILANQIFNNYQQYKGIDIIIGVVAFTFQIYGDFSGYSDIARGVAKLLGFELMVNFRLPYFAVNPSDFWNRWHISLSTWLRDYLYIPLGGNRKGKIRTHFNLFMTMLLGGLWHGAAWNFIIWGSYHGIILILYRIFERNPVHADPWSGKHNYLVVILKMAFMFILTCIGWLIFRADSVEQITGMLTSALQFGTVQTQWIDFMSTFGWHIIILLLFNLWQYRSRNLLAVTHSHWFLQSLIFCFLIIWIIVFGVRESSEFIYFQF